MRNVVVCDDDEHTRELLSTYLSQISDEYGERFSVHCFCSGEELISQLPDDTDILLLDIKMYRLSGMDAARILRERNNNICIIFITTMAQYAIEGYEVHAFGFLKKPVSYRQLSRCITEALRSIAKNEGCMITINHMANTERINTNDIIYIESFGHSMKIVTRNECLKSASTLSEFETRLKKHGFLKSHKSYLVNLRHVKKINDNTLTLSNKSEILLSRYRRKEFMSEFAGYVGELL